MAGGNFELVREERLRAVEALLRQAVEAARAAGVTEGDLREMFELALEEDERA